MEEDWESRRSDSWFFTKYLNLYLHIGSYYFKKKYVNVWIEKIRVKNASVFCFVSGGWSRQFNTNNPVWYVNNKKDDTSSSSSQEWSSSIIHFQSWEHLHQFHFCLKLTQYSVPSFIIDTKPSKHKIDFRIFLSLCVFHQQPSSSSFVCKFVGKRKVWCFIFKREWYLLCWHMEWKFPPSVKYLQYWVRAELSWESCPKSCTMARKIYVGPS